MSSGQGQTFANHARFVPLYHFVASLIFLYNLVYSIKAAVQHPDGATITGAVLAVGLVLLFLYARSFAATAQDRIIRLEETLRMERLLPADLKARIGEIAPAQFVALRFAPDTELPELVRRTLAGEFAKPVDIKKAIKNWRGDYLRV